MRIVVRLMAFVLGVRVRVRGGCRGWIGWWWEGGYLQKVPVDLDLYKSLRPPASADFCHFRV